MATSNKVNEKQMLSMNQKSLQASKKIFLEIKYAKLSLYFINILPLILSFFFVDEKYKMALAAVSFALTLLNEFLKATFSNFKEKAISLKALFEANVTDTVYAKIEYDRESTNEVYELSIRKSQNAINNAKYRLALDIPSDIPDKYSYLYMSRIQVAESRFLLSKVKLSYGILLVIVAAIIIVLFFNKNLSDTIYQIVMLWNLIIPLVSNFTTCSKNMRHCVKLSADIDNFFADGDRSKERLARFNYYIQGLVFEYRLALVIIPKSFYFIYKKHIKALRQGATLRFYEALQELEDKERQIIKQNAKKIEFREVFVEPSLKNTDLVLNAEKKKIVKTELSLPKSTEAKTNISPKISYSSNPVPLSLEKKKAVKADTTVTKPNVSKENNTTDSPKKIESKPIKQTLKKTKDNMEEKPETIKIRAVSKNNLEKKIPSNEKKSIKIKQ